MAEPSLVGTLDENLVSWQSVFWALVPLAINVMTQPCGRICGMDPITRTYIRSSPIFCGFDTLAIIINFLVHLFNGVGPLRAAKSIVAARFEGIDDEVEGLQYLEKVTFIRWVVFIITLTQSIKLFALRGVPGSQAWGYLFLASYVAIEVVILLGNAYERLQTTNVSLLPRWMDSLITAGESDLISRRIEHIRLYMQKVDHICAILAVILQICLLSWVVWQICGFPVIDTDDSWYGIYLILPPMYAIEIFWFGLYCIGSLAFLAVAAIPWWGEETLKKEFKNPGIWIALKKGCMIFRVIFSIVCIALACGFAFGCYKACLVYLNSEVAVGWTASVLWEIGLVLLLPPILYAICIGLSKISILRKQVLFTEDHLAAEGVLAALVMFIMITISTVLWYELRYDPTGTFKPDWTNRLG